MEGNAPAPSMAEAAPSFDAAAFAPDVGASFPFTESSDAYEGSMEWTAADQAAFEGAVVENNSNQPDLADILGVQTDVGDDEKVVDEGETPDTPDSVRSLVSRTNSAPADNRQAAESYFAYQSAADQQPFAEDKIFNTLFEDPRALNNGFWLSDLDTGEATDPNLQQGHQAALKYVAAELGLAVEDVTLQTDEGMLTDTLIRSYKPEELPAEPVRKGDVYICEGRTLSETEAARVIAARHWAQEAGEEALKGGLGSQVLAAVNAMGSNTEYAVTVTYNAPVEDTVRVTAEPSIKIPQLPYEHYSVGSQDIFLAKVNSPDQPALPTVQRTSEMLGYDVDHYQSVSSTGVRDAYDAQLHT